MLKGKMPQEYPTVLSSAPKEDESTPLALSAPLSYCTPRHPCLEPSLESVAGPPQSEADSTSLNGKVSFSDPVPALPLQQAAMPRVGGTVPSALVYVPFSTSNI